MNNIFDIDRPWIDRPETIDTEYSRWIDVLECNFDDELISSGATNEIQDIIISNRDTSHRPVCYLIVIDDCIERENKKQCLDFFLRYLNTRPEHGFRFQARYESRDAMELNDANKIQRCLRRRRRRIDELSLWGDLFKNVGTFECIFNAVLDGGNVKEFDVQAESILDLCRGGCIGRSNFASNTTLETLELRLFDEDDDIMNVTQYQEGMEQLANALRRNQGLKNLHLSWGIITNTRRRFLLESLRDNTTLLKLSTIEDCPDPSKFGRHFKHMMTRKIQSSIEIQSSIDRHMNLNRFWNRLQRFPYRDFSRGSSSDNDSDDDEEEDYSGGGVEQRNAAQQRQRKERKPISLKIYPDILEVLAKKPLLLYKFLRGGEKGIVVDHTQLFDRTKMLLQQRRGKRQRRSDRIIKKRRIVGPGNAY
ncbi:hypothetical protein FRACYDRAFT_236255 [Fragilariopsis cylindrus CCMP1102]|uniref:Uncharacterized protein n=1 Tax=Fragilariopsis cylindrus CCMP1102 TaxID=635003 RepID=A0A1E7FPW3_9STRA|nr:hypothetical protein FRACYDRAFT_236255 [Fragilariopsis cylindrus CCMP1102]|eukprot:OEU20186.1 hypothetical protein FRACYDRAFT_236255 [Fragilariopsis cylindrus CCMP1102]